MKGFMNRLKKTICIGTTCALIAGSVAVPAWTARAEEGPGQEAAVEETVGTTLEDTRESTPEGQLTMEDLSALNNGKETVYVHNDRVTLVDGTCTADPVKSTEDAAAVVDSMMTLIGADANTAFVPWNEVRDPAGNTYYIFQQMFQDTTVCGGAVKVITDKNGNMIALTSSVESEMPDVDTGTGITAGEAQQIVVEREYSASGVNLDILSQFTDKVILPSVLGFDIENEDESSRFAWVVYTNNPSGSNQQGSDLPYLAHYVSMSGEYLYNLPAITPDDEAGRSGFDTSYVFEFMEPVEYTGYVDLSDGSEKEITVTVMRDKRTGMYYLGNIERRIIVGECYDFLYKDGQIVLESSPDNREWDQVGLLSLYNYCRAYDYYKEIGWIGGDGQQTPILILNNFCDDHYNGINNACYVGKLFGMQCFAASSINDFSQCLDIIAHEFTHCVTGSVMTYNSYMNDYGAINEAISDIQGQNCEMMSGDVEMDDWLLGSNSQEQFRSMENPHRYAQPAFTWDLYYQANVETPSSSNDHGGVHFNSSLLNQVAYLLVARGGMTLEEARTFWFMTDCAMVPQTDYEQLAELLPVVLKAAGMEKYEDALAEAIDATRLGEKEMPETIEDDRALLTIALPDTEAFDTGNWMMLLTSVELENLVNGIKTVALQLINKDYSILPETVQRYIEEAGVEAQQKIEEEKEKSLTETFITSLLEGIASLAEGEKIQEEKVTEPDEETKKILKDLYEWAVEGFQKVFFLSYGFAGQDGSTINMVVRPGRTIPMLQHAVADEISGEPDQLVLAVYINGKWYDLGIAEAMKADEGEEDAEEAEKPDVIGEIVKDVLGENLENLWSIRSLDDVLDLFTIDIKGGEILELSADGLDKIVIPEPMPEEEKVFAVPEPGMKSRPKPETTEETTEPETEAEAESVESAESETVNEENAGSETKAEASEENLDKTA